MLVASGGEVGSGLEAERWGGFITGESASCDGSELASVSVSVSASAWWWKSETLACLEACGVVSFFPSISEGDIVVASALSVPGRGDRVLLSVLGESEFAEEEVSGRRTVNLGGKVV